MAINKTIKLKKTPIEEPAAAEAEATATPAEASPAKPAAPVGLESASTAPRVASKSYLVFALFGIAATVFCMAVIGLQVAEWMFYKADPSVWPVK